MFKDMEVPEVLGSFFNKLTHRNVKRAFAVTAVAGSAALGAVKIAEASSAQNEPNPTGKAGNNNKPLNIPHEPVTPTPDKFIVSTDGREREEAGKSAMDRLSELDKQTAIDLAEEGMK